MADSSLSSALVRNGLIILMLLATLLSVSLANVQCSCYTFHDNTTLRDWDVSNKECKANGGQLVSMETLEEWEFIKTQLQTRTTSSSQDQWWVGLTRDNGVWQWDSGSKLTYNKWKPQLDLYKTGKAHAIVEKNQGILWNTYWYQTMGSICEQRNTNCGANQVKRCYNTSVTSTTSLPPKTTLRDSTVALATSKVVRDVPQSTETSFITSHTTAVASVTLSAYSTEQVNTENTEIRRRKTSTSLTMKVVIIIIVAVVLLLIIGIIIIVICICRRRHRARTRKKNKDEQEKFILQPQNGNNEPNYEPNTQPNDEPKSIQKPYIYATVDKTAKTKNKTPEPIYENWRKPMYVNVEMPIYENFQQANHSMPQELNYVSVSECTGNDIHTEAPKPLEYEPTEYATLDINDPNN